MTDEKRLFKAIQSNRQDLIDETFNYLYDKYKPLVVFIASKFLKISEDIKDIVQDTFIEMFKNAENIHTSIKGYLCTACKHNALRLLQKQKRVELVDIEDLDATQVTIDNNPSDAYNTLISDMKLYLTPEEIKIIIFHLIDNCKFNDLALKLNQNVNAIKATYYRALKKYQKMKGVNK